MISFIGGQVFRTQPFHLLDGSLKDQVIFKGLGSLRVQAERTFNRDVMTWTRLQDDVGIRRSLSETGNCSDRMLDDSGISLLSKPSMGNDARGFGLRDRDPQKKRKRHLQQKDGCQDQVFFVALACH